MDELEKDERYGKVIASPGRKLEELRNVLTSKFNIDPSGIEMRSHKRVCYNQGGHAKQEYLTFWLRDPVFDEKGKNVSGSVIEDALVGAFSKIQATGRPLISVSVPYRYFEKQVDDQADVEIKAAPVQVEPERKTEEEYLDVTPAAELAC